MGHGRGRKRPDEDNGFAQWGGYMEAKKAKLEDQFRETAINTEEQSEIFKGIAIYVNGHTNPNADELKKIMTLNGGVFQVYQSSATTHIIASNLPNVKINKLGSVPIVKPSWITDSLTLGKLLDYRRYLLYTNQSSTQPRLEFPVLPQKSLIEPHSAKTASDPTFLNEFFNNSRLHLIATLGAEYKQLITDLRDKPQHTFPGLARLPPSQDPRITPKDTVIMHIDMDCFFVSVGLRTRPDLKDKPVAVTHARNPQINATKEREAAVTWNLDRMPQECELIDGRSSMSEVASCSYAARKCGVRNGMFLGAAVKLCPDLQTIPYDFEGIKEVSNLLYETLISYTLDIEAVSCDEMYVDVTSILKVGHLSVGEWSNHIRSAITAITKCPCSTGFGANRLQARMATKRAKPANSFHLLPEHVDEYMADIPLANLPGVGRSILGKLQSLNLNCCGDVQMASMAVLQKELGPKIGETIAEQARGIDRKPLNYCHERKSISAEVNYGIRFKVLEECLAFLESLSVEVWNRLNDVKLRAKGITLKLMVRAEDAPIETAKFLGHGICDNLSKSVTLSSPISDASVIYREIKLMYDKFNVDFKELRGVGIQLSKLEKPPVINPAMSKFLQQVSTKKPENYIVEKPVKNPVEKPVKNPVKKRNSNKTQPLNKFFKNTKEGLSQQTKPTTKIDLEVLKALPPDLRLEVIEEYNLNVDLAGNAPEETSKSAVDKQQLDKSPFSNLQWCQLKPVLHEWMRSESEPKLYDVNMLGEHFKQMAINRQIEFLQVAMNFLHRNFSQLDCQWHQAYDVIVNVMQEGMVARYGSVLFIKRHFDCCSL